MPHFVAVCGSLDPRSSNAALLDAAAELLPEGCTLSRFDGLAEVPPFVVSRADAPPAGVRAWRAALASADGVVFASPEYAHGLAGAMKNALDWVVGSGEVSGKPVALLAASTSVTGGTRGLLQLTQVLSAMDAAVVEVVPVGTARAKIKDGRLVDEATRTRLAGALVGLAAAATAMAGSRPAPAAPTPKPPAPQAAYLPVDPAEGDRLARWLASDTWPFHTRTRPSFETALELVGDGLFSGREAASYWVRLDGEDVGLLTVRDLQDDVPLLDLRLKTEVRGRGLGEQALRWLTDEIFKTWPHFQKIEGQTREDNVPMRALFRKLGYVKEAHYRSVWPTQDGHRLASIAYGLLRSDWEQGTTTPVAWFDD